MKIYFISKDANWQKYRFDVLDKLASNYYHEIEILTTGTIKPYLKDNQQITYKSFSSILKGKYSFMPGIIWYILKNKPDAVLALNNVSFITEYVVCLLCKLVNIKFVWWTHAYDHKKKSNGFLAKMKEQYVLFFLKKGSSIITFSENGREYLISKKINPAKIFTAANTINTDDVIQTKNKFSNDKILIKQKFGFDLKDKIVLFTGRLTKEKKIDHLIKAVHLLKNDFQNNLKLIIIGDGIEKENLKKISTNLNLENISFLGEIYDEEILAQWFLISDVYVMPAYVGLGIIHAFCYDLPIITEVDENHGPEIQYLKHGLNGFQVKENNIEELSEKMKELLLDDEKLIEFSKQAFNTVVEKGNINLMVKNMNEAITLGEK